MIKIEVFVLPGCPRCSSGLDTLKEVAASFSSDMFIWHERDLLQSIDDAVKLGILASPAIAIDGKLAFAASLPTPQQFRDTLSKYVSV
jgi:thioredoxin 1